MAPFFIIYNRTERGMKESDGKEIAGVKIAPAQTTAPVSSGNVEDAEVLKVEATTLAECQNMIESYLPGKITGTPIVVTEAQFKAV